MSSTSPPLCRCGSAAVPCVVLGEESTLPCLCQNCRFASVKHAAARTLCCHAGRAIKLHAPDIRSITTVIPCAPSKLKQYPCLKMPSAMWQCMCQCIASHAYDSANLTASADIPVRCLNDVISRRCRAIAQQLRLLTPRDRACSSTCQVAASRQHAAKLHDRVGGYCGRMRFDVCMHVILYAGRLLCRRALLDGQNTTGGHGCTPC